MLSKGVLPWNMGGACSLRAQDQIRDSEREVSYTQLVLDPSFPRRCGVVIVEEIEHLKDGGALLQNGHDYSFPNCVLPALHSDTHSLLSRDRPSSKQTTGRCDSPGSDKKQKNLKMILRKD